MTHELDFFSELRDQLVAAESRLEIRPPVRRRRRAARWTTLAAVPVAVAAALVIGLVLTTRSSAPTTATPATPAAPHLLTDGFNYKAGGVSSSAAPPALLYAVPRLWGISAASKNAAWIVGYQDSGYGLAWQWNGTKWRNVAMPGGTGNVRLPGVATLSATDAWAVGSQAGPSGQYQATRPLVEHWDGRRWTVVPIPETGPGALFAVSAVSPSDIWAVGTTYARNSHGTFRDPVLRPLLMHWDGTAWRTVAVPWARADLELDAVVANANNVWVVSTGSRDVRTILVELWDGHRWSQVPAPFGQHDPIRGFSATSGSDAWAVGAYQTSGHSHPLAAHWNGRVWQIAPTPSRNTDSDLTNVVAVGPNDVWALGQSQYLKVTHTGSGCADTCELVHQSWPVALYEHWNGVRWQIMPGVTPQMWNNGTLLTATKDGSAWAAGGCLTDNVVTRWNGEAWQYAQHPPDKYRHGRAPGSEQSGFGSCLAR